MDRGLISIGLPVRNGGKALELAINSLISQDYENLEIIISDNNSDDETKEICKKYEKIDNRVKVFRQENLISAFDNFQFVLKKSSGDFFMWAAHDDVRDKNYVSCLLSGFNKIEDTILTFSDLYIDNKIDESYKIDFDFDNTNFDTLNRLKKTANRQCYHIYGLWKRELLTKIYFKHTFWWPDMPIMMCAAYLGKFKYVEGTRFIYTEEFKDTKKRVSYQDGKKSVPKFLFLKMLLTTFITLKNTSNSFFYSFLGTFFVFFRHFKLIPKYIINRLKK